MRMLSVAKGADKKHQKTAHQKNLEKKTSQLEAFEKSDMSEQIKEAFPDAIVEIQDLAGDENHYSATIKSKLMSYT